MVSIKGRYGLGAMGALKREGLTLNIGQRVMGKSFPGRAFQDDYRPNIKQSDSTCTLISVNWHYISVCRKR